MPRIYRLLTIMLATLLAACAPAVPGTTPTGTIGTALVSTAEPISSSELPPEQTPLSTLPAPAQTPIPTLNAGLGPTELKYRLLAEFPDLFFCDPDFYPVARADELELALQRFSELQANPEEFNTILAHNNLAGLATFTDAQKLLIYREHKRLAAIQLELSGEGYQFQLQVAQAGEDASGELISGMIDGRGTIIVQQRQPTIATCPICLAAGMLIDTPSGPVPVESLRPGVLVWTMDRAGLRQAQPIARVGKTHVPDTHQVVQLVLNDGRQLWVSPGHPTIDGRQVGDLQAGDTLDGGVVRSAERVRYTGAATYDLLPAGETGFYWANGVLLASTLRPIASGRKAFW
jgi:hypothetical protein